jgi:excisionase family DNA binding protein
MDRDRDKLLYSVPEAASVLSVGKSTAWAMIARGELTAVRVGGRRLVTRAELERFVGQLAQDPPRCDRGVHRQRD